MFTVGRLVGSCSPATDNDGHATKRPSTFFEHRRSLIQPTRKPTDLTNPSTESDQVHSANSERRRLTCSHPHRNQTRCKSVAGCQRSQVLCHECAKRAIRLEPFQSLSADARGTQTRSVKACEAHMADQSSLRRYTGPMVQDGGRARSSRFMGCKKPVLSQREGGSSAGVRTELYRR